jgi:hypothetical protein
VYYGVVIPKNKCVIKKVDNLSSNCLIAWKDVLRAGIISPSFPAKVHLTKVAPAVVHRQVKMSKPCTEPNMAIKGVNVTNMPICAELNVDRKRVNLTNMPICAELNADIKHVNMTSKSINSVLKPRTVKRTTVTASTACQPHGSCLKHNLTDDT